VLAIIVWHTQGIHRAYMPLIVSHGVQEKSPTGTRGLAVGSLGVKPCAKYRASGTSCADNMITLTVTRNIT
jgi:hypothetical protein